MNRRGFIKSVLMGLAALVPWPKSPGRSAADTDARNESIVGDNWSEDANEWEQMPPDDTARLQALVSVPGAVVEHETFYISGTVECSEGVTITECLFSGPGRIELGRGSNAARVEYCIFDNGPKLVWRMH